MGQKACPTLPGRSATCAASLRRTAAVTMYVGVAVLGRVGGEMMLGDALVRKLLHPSDTVRYGVELPLMAAIVVTGRLLSRR